jgi:hypothetical protein
MDTAMSNIVIIFSVNDNTEIHTNIDPILISARAAAKQAVTRGQANANIFDTPVVDET